MNSELIFDLFVLISKYLIVRTLR